MRTAGCELHQHIENMAFMGFVAVLAHWREVIDNFRIARQALLEEKPDVLILIDYPSFNLRMAKFCRRHLPDTKIVYSTLGRRAASIGNCLIARSKYLGLF